MSFELGTYGSAVLAPMLGYCMPTPNEAITYDWMDVVGQFTQRFRRIATVIVTVAEGGTTTFDFTALRCDYFPPYLRAYYNRSGLWDTYTPPQLTGSFIAPPNESYYIPYSIFSEVGLSTAKFINKTGVSRSWLLTAYL